MNASVKALEPFEAIILTGGSSGIGKAILNRALSIKIPIIINLSRSKPNIKGTTENFKHIRTDLSRTSEITSAYKQIEQYLESENVKGPILLINNSGFGCYGKFPSPDLKQNLKMLDVNLRAPVHLTGLLLSRIHSQGGGVVNIASTAAFQPLAYMSVYAAAKAFLMNWGLALHQELKRSGAFCLTVCPGPTSTEFFDRAGFEGEPTMGMGQTADQVAQTTFRAIQRKKSLVVSGLLNRMLAAFTGSLPRRWIAPLAARFMAGLRLEKYRKDQL